MSAFTLPPKHRRARRRFADGTIPGAIHIHTKRSDGRGTVDEIAAAAARAGLKFIVFTDHGDATRAPDPPAYRAGVLCLDAVEISTAGGHYIALDMPQAPYPLAGQARDVVEDVTRLGGFGIAAHPDSPKPQLRWREWTAPFDAIEFVNPDTSWRQRIGGVAGPRGAPDALLVERCSHTLSARQRSIAGADSAGGVVDAVGGRGQPSPRRRIGRNGRPRADRGLALERSRRNAAACRFRATSRHSARSRSTSGRNGP